MLQMDARDHRTVTAPLSGREKTRRHRHDKDAGHGKGNVQGQGNGNGTGHGQGDGNGTGHGQGDGNGTGNGNGTGHGQGNGNGTGHGQGNSSGNAPVLSVLSQLPGRGSGVTAIERPPNASRGQMKAGSLVPEGIGGIVWQLAGVGARL
jgi:hypothetical protein